jgi:acyl-CoA synthetase (AMP-forming)/AMP-acid ligase II
MGEELKALVVPADPAAPPKAEEILAFCRDRLSHYKCPRSLEYVDTVGRNSMGKVNKKKLRAPYWQNAK